MQQNERTLSWTGLEELRPSLLSYAKRRCRNEAEAEDVIQETMLRAARYRPALTNPERLKAWVLRIAANVHRDSMRRESRYIRTENQEEWLHSIECTDAGSGTSGVVAEHGTLGSLNVEMHEALHHLPAAIGELRECDREVLDCFYRGRESCLDLARRFEISRSLAKVRVFRARKRLSKVLRKRLSLKNSAPAEVLA